MSTSNPTPATSAGQPPAQRSGVWSWLVLGAVLIGGLVYLAHSRRSARIGADASTAPLGPANPEGRLAPEWTLQDPNGNTVTLAQYKGRPVVLDFWATWCGPCQIEMPWWQQLQKQYADRGLAIIGISEDSTVADVKKYLAVHPLNYQVVMDLSQLESTYGDPFGMPTTLFIDRDGKIVSRLIGLEGKDVLDANIHKIL